MEGIITLKTLTTIRKLISILEYSKCVSEPTFLSVAINAAQAASNLHQFYAGSDVDISTKTSHSDLVTEVDKLCEEKLREVILASFPEHAVLGEEGGETQGNATHRWIIDPLDGTLNYAHGFPFYGVSIALEINGVLEVGVVLDSTLNEMFYATKGGGAFCNGTPIRVSSTLHLRQALIATGFSSNPELFQKNVSLLSKVLPRVRAIRRPGSAALVLCYIACGRLDGLWELKLEPWDMAAGLLILQEAGGSITGPTGKVHQLSEKTVIASNGYVHKELLHLLDLGKVE
jgi:myo-inositol-1(or 4)-monophosphatase